MQVGMGVAVILNDTSFTRQPQILHHTEAHWKYFFLRYLRPFALDNSKMYPNTSIWKNYVVQLD